MATQTDVLKLIMQVQGQEEVRALEGSIEQFRQIIRDLSADLAANTITQQQFADLAGQSAQQILQMEARIKQLGGATRNMGMAALEGSRALEDLQYGVAGVVNNIPGLVMSLGGSAGLTAAISLGAVAINQLVKHWGEFREAIGLAGTESEAERMERLEHATHRTAKETEDLNRHKKEQAEIQRLLDSQTPDVEGQKGAVGKALAGHAGQLVEALTRQRIASGGGADALVTDDADKEDLAALRRDLAREQADARNPRLGAGVRAQSAKNADYLQGEIDKMLARYGTEDDAGAASKLLVGATTDPGKLKQLIDDLNRMGGGPVPGLMGDLTNALPENARAQRELELQGQARGRQLRQEFERQKKARADQEHAEDEATNQQNDAHLANVAAETAEKKQAAAAADVAKKQDEARRLEIDRNKAAEAKRIADAEVREGQHQKAGLEGTPYTHDDLRREVEQFSPGISPEARDAVVGKAISLRRSGEQIEQAMTHAFLQVAEELRRADMQQMQMMRQFQMMAGGLPAQQGTVAWPVAPGF